MSLLSFFKRASTAPQGAKPALRRATVEWRTEAGEKIQQRVLLQSDRVRGLFAFVKQGPAEGSVVEVREQDSSYLVEVLSTREATDGLELELEYVLEGRRREPRIRAQGAGLLLVEGAAPLQVEVLNISSGGMQLFSTGTAKEGSAARMYGSDTNRICFVRYCIVGAGGYLIGVQFYGKDQEPIKPDVNL